jgi:hypothetical protein
MSMKDFHAKLVSTADQNPLFAALRKLSQATDIQRLMTEEPQTEWNLWSQDPEPGPGLASA